MKILSFIMVGFLVTAHVFAADSVVLISPTAEYASADRIADNIKSECTLPVYQSLAMRRHLEELGISAQLATTTNIPSTGKFLRIRIEEAVSMGNAFSGHHKQVTTSAVYFEDGKEVAKTTKMRNSMGGFAGGFKGSCDVLQRCADTLGKDIAKWLQEEMKTGKSAKAK